jgi:hypothetical protein
MKHLKIYEIFDYKWKNIEEKNDKLYVNLYGLANEMSSVAKGNKPLLVKMESEYFDLVRKLLIGKVITFTGEDDDITGVCDDVVFHSGFGPPSDEDDFQFQYIEVKTENMEDGENIEDEDKVIIHLDIDPIFFRSSHKYNL